jgi:hypothetical protein
LFGLVAADEIFRFETGTAPSRFKDWTLVASYGMGRRLSFTTNAYEIDSKTAARLPIDIRKEISEILEQQLSRAKSIASANVIFMEKLAAELLAKGKVGADDVRAMARSFVRLKS